MDKLSPAQRRKNMQAIKNKGSAIEIKLGKALWKAGVRYRKNSKMIYGTPDFSVKKIKLAIFCDSEFWHGKDWEIHKNEIQTNKEFWITKITKNIERDEKVNLELRNNGWTVIRIWGKEITKDIDSCVNLVLSNIKLLKSNSHLKV